jgi:hypothetical protein
MKIKPPKQKVIETDAGIEVWCARDQMFLPEIEFSTSPRVKTGYYWICDKCKQEINEFRIGKPGTNFNKVQSRKILENLGYKYDDEFTIHEQFLIRHNLI